MAPNAQHHNMYSSFSTRAIHTQIRLHTCIHVFTQSVMHHTCSVISHVQALQGLPFLLKVVFHIIILPSLSNTRVLPFSLSHEAREQIRRFRLHYGEDCNTEPLVSLLYCNTLTILYCCCYTTTQCRV